MSPALLALFSTAWQKIIKSFINMAFCTRHCAMKSHPESSSSRSPSEIVENPYKEDSTTYLVIFCANHLSTAGPDLSDPANQGTYRRISLRIWPKKCDASLTDATSV